MFCIFFSGLAFGKNIYVCVWKVDQLSALQKVTVVVVVVASVVEQ